VLGPGGGALVGTDTHDHPCAGWKTPETALVESQKLLRSIILLLMGSSLLGCQTTASDAQFVDYGELAARVD